MVVALFNFLKVHAWQKSVVYMFVDDQVDGKDKFTSYFLNNIT